MPIQLENNDNFYTNQENYNFLPGLFPDVKNAEAEQSYLAPWILLAVGVSSSKNYHLFLFAPEQELGCVITIDYYYSPGVITIEYYYRLGVITDNCSVRPKLTLPGTARSTERYLKKEEAEKIERER